MSFTKEPAFYNNLYSFDNKVSLFFGNQKIVAIFEMKLFSPE